MRAARLLLAALGWTVLGVAAALGLSLSLFAALAAAPFARPFVASRVVSILDDAVAGSLRLRSIEVLSRGGIELRGLEVLDPDGHLVLSVERARAFVDVTALSRRAVGLTVELDAPSVLLEEEEGGGVSIARAFAPSRPRRDAGEEGGGWTLLVSRLTVRRGDLWWVDAAGETRVQASALDLDGRGLVGPGRKLVDLRLRGDLEAPVAAPLALDVAGGITGHAVRVPVLRAELGGASLAAVGEGDLARRSGRLAVTHLGVSREVARALAPRTPKGDDLSAAAYAESDGTLLTLGLHAEPAESEGRGRADAALAAQVADPARALGFDVALDRLDPSRLAAVAPRGEVTLVARGAAAGRSLRELRARLTATVQRSRLRGGEISRAELALRADRGAVDLPRLTLAAPGVALDATLRWREGGEVSGTVSGDASDLGVALANAGALLGRELPRLSGRGRLAATLGGTSDAPALSATLDAPLLRGGGTFVSGVRLTADAAGPLAAPRGRFDGTIATLRGGPDELAHAIVLRGTFAEEAGSVSATASLPGLHDPASLEARGTLGPGRKTLALASLTFGYPGTRWTLAAPATVTFAGPSVDRLELVSGVQRIAVAGGLGPRGALDARAELARIELARLPAGLLPAGAAIRGVVDARLAASGTTAAPEASATFSLEGGAFQETSGLAGVGSARWSGAARRASGTISLARGGVTLDVAADLPLPVAGRPAEAVRASARAAGVPVEEVLAAAGIEAEVTGVLALDATLEGTAGAPALHATASLADATYEDLEALALRVEAEAPGERLRLSARGALEGREVARLDAEAPLDLAEVLGRPAAARAALRTAPLEGSVAVTGLDLARLAGRLGVPEGTAGIVEGTGALSGSLAAPRAAATVAVTGGALAGYRGLGGRVEVALRDEAVLAKGGLTLAGEEAARFEASLGAPPERLATQEGLRGASLRAEVLVPGLALERASSQDLALTGKLSGRLAAAGTPRAPEVTVSLAGEGVAVEGRPLGGARLEARYARARATAEAELRPPGGGTVRATGTLDADLGVGAARGPLGEAPVEATIVADALDLGFLDALFPGVVRSAAGKLALDVRAKGPLARPSPRGTLHVEGARLAVSEYGDWSGIAVDATVTDDAIEVSRLQVRRGRGKLEGKGSLRGLRSARATLEAHAAAQGFTVSRAGMDLATVDGKVDATGTLAGSTLAVEVAVARSEVKLPRKSPRELQTLEARKDIQVGRRRPDRRRSRAAASLAAAAVTARGEGPFTFTAHVVAPRGVFVKGDDPKIDVELKADVRYERVGGEDYAEGAVEVVRGGVEPFGGRAFEIQRGRVQFTGGPPTAATLDVEARYVNPAAVVTVIVQGPVAKPEMRLSSQPPMDDSQIAMLIATGRTELKAGSGAVGTITGEEAGKAALGAIATQAFKNLVANKLPLDTVSIESGAFRAGTYLPGGKIFVGYTRRFEAVPERGENVDEIRVEYQITPRWTFESRYGNAQAGGASLIWSKDY